VALDADVEVEVCYRESGTRWMEATDVGSRTIAHERNLESQELRVQVVFRNGEEGPKQLGMLRNGSLSLVSAGKSFLSLSESCGGVS
jgi:hypothetical protein